MEYLKQAIIEKIDHLDRVQLLALHEYLDRLQGRPGNPARESGQEDQEQKPDQ